MTYRRPGITVTQEFVGLVPALAGFNLPSVVVGPAYQLVDDDSLGLYSGSQTDYAYASLIGGSIVDTSTISLTEKFPATKKPISVVMRNTVLEVAAETTDGVAIADSFTDAITASFANAQPGDRVKIVPALGVAIVAPQTGGSIPDTVGQRNRLTKAGAFAKAKVGDIVGVTAGTNVTVGNYPIAAVISADMVVVTGNINDGVGPTSDADFTLTGDRGVDNEGSYRIKLVVDANTVVLESALPENEAALKYTVIREAGTVDIPRVATTLLNGFVADEAKITLPGSGVLKVGTLPIIAGNVEANYRALRIDFAANLREFKSIDDIDAAFGTGQITPANPLAYGIQFMLQNTVTAVNALGLNADAVSDEVLAFNSAAAKLKMTDMYAIALLTQNVVVHTMYKNHVDQMSLPGKKKERVVLINSKLIEVMTLQAMSTTTSDLVAARTVVGTSLDASATATEPTKLTDTTPNKFQNVKPGDKVKILGGTNANVATYTVVSVPDNNNVVVSGNIISGGSSTDFSYVIVRPDGVSSDGARLYDRNATFISNGVSAGHYVVIESPSGIAAKFKVGSVLSEQELVFATPIAGVITHQNPVIYKVERNLSTAEMAESIKGYSEAIGSRRVVHCWPDVVKTSVGANVVLLPGFYQCAVVAALISGLPTQQGFTNMSVSGFLGYEHAHGFFDDDELDVIADGGTMIFQQDGEGQPLYIRHQLTTDRSSIKFQELSVTKNVDFIAKHIRQTYAPFIGQYNIVDSTMDSLKTTAAAEIIFLKDVTKLPRIGGNIRSGSLKEIFEDPNQIDTVRMRFGFSIPIPLNNLDIVIEV